MTGLPVLNADAVVQIFIPTQNTYISEHSIIPLHDNGLGYPDITSGDGIYHLLRLLVTAMDGHARIPLSK